jgi:hypothetical protein
MYCILLITVDFSHIITKVDSLGVKAQDKFSSIFSDVPQLCDQSLRIPAFFDLCYLLTTVTDIRHSYC